MEDINGSRPNAAPKPKKRPNRFVRFLAFLVTLALMVGAVALVANYDKLNFDFIKRWFSYRTLARNDSGQAESFHFVGDSSNAFAVVDGDLLVCSPNTIRLYSGSGQAFVDQAVSMTNPVVSTAGGTALVYDAGGRELFVYSGREEVFSLTQEDGQALLSADVNQNGWLAVTSQESGHKGSVTVYDNSYSPLVRFSLSNRFVMDAAVAPDNKSVALLTIGLTDGNFESRVDLYRLDRTEEETEPDWTCPVGNNAILDLRWTSSGIWALGAFPSARRIPRMPLPLCPLRNWPCFPPRPSFRTSRKLRPRLRPARCNLPPGRCYSRSRRSVWWRNSGSRYN